MLLYAIGKNLPLVVPQSKFDLKLSLFLCTDLLQGLEVGGCLGKSVLGFCGPDLSLAPLVLQLQDLLLEALCLRFAQILLPANHISHLLALLCREAGTRGGGGRGKLGRGHCAMTDFHGTVAAADCLTQELVVTKRLHEVRLQLCYLGPLPLHWPVPIHAMFTVRKVPVRQRQRSQVAVDELLAATVLVQRFLQRPDLVLICGQPPTQLRALTDERQVIGRRFILVHPR